MAGGVTARAGRPASSDLVRAGGRRRSPGLAGPRQRYINEIAGWDLMEGNENRSVFYMFFKNSSVVSSVWLSKEERAVASGIPVKYRLIVLAIAIAIIAAITAFPDLGRTFEVSVLS